MLSIRRVGRRKENPPVKYWIIADPMDRELLEHLGVKIGRWDANEGEFRDCEIPNLDQIDRYWGRFVWGPQD